MKFFRSSLRILFLTGMAAVCGGAALPLQKSADLKLRVSWGHQSPERRAFHIRLGPTMRGISIESQRGVDLEPGESATGGTWRTESGAGDVDGIEAMLSYVVEAKTRLQNLHIIWADLISASDPETARRLSGDAAFNPDFDKLTIQTNADGTQGFSVSLDQLLQNRALWIPSLDIYVSVGSDPLNFDEHLQELSTRKGQRILDQVRHGPEATYEEFTALWEDMGHPVYENPQPRGPGHIVGLTWDSAIPKFGIDRGAGVWNDYGNPDHFRLWFDFGNIEEGLARSWQSQKLQDGLPIITTVFEKEGVRYEVEQFAYPLHGPPAERRGDIAMVLLQRLTAVNLTDSSRRVPVTMSHRREFPSQINFDFVLEERDGTAVFLESAFRRVVLAVEGLEEAVDWSGVRDYQREQRRFDATVYLSVPPGERKSIWIKLPSPTVPDEDRQTLLSLDPSQAREETVEFWTEYVARGARFEVPEKVVNDLFRASLWHSLRLPRRHGGDEEGVRIDLPYSNFAYSQVGTPWPVNQAVYVDYMIYDLRGYHGISAEELLAMYRNNQEHDGHVGGYANWGVYTPGMLYVVAKHYLLSRDRKSLERLMTPTLEALDWCLRQVRRAEQRPGPTSGLFDAPLNDGTGEGVWAFNQAYMYAGLAAFGRVLQQIDHPRAGETLEAAERVRRAVERAFSHASVQAPLVQLRDYTWVPYVPNEVNTPRRLLEQWYPTDVDTGAVHLIRLKALQASSSLADYLLNDHEDNLFYKGWGMANEPVYNQQLTAYLLRDDVNAVIRGFYSYMASAFSHSVLEPVEHRWTHGQYFGPPSTDGAWFEVYRHMLIHEQDDGRLLLAQATPRQWLQDGKEIVVERAPSFYGPLSFRIQSRVASGQIRCSVNLPENQPPAAVLIRMRHPEQSPIRSVEVNGNGWDDFDVEQEWIRIQRPRPGHYEVVVRYRVP